MSRSVVGLLAAVGTITSALVGLAHGDVVPVMIMGAGTATGLAAFLALPSKKNGSLSDLVRASVRTSSKAA